VLAGVSPDSAGPVGDWQFNENNKGVAFDSSTYISATVGGHASLGAGGTDTATWPEQTVVSALPQALYLDTDGDGLTDACETRTGSYVDAGNTGTDPCAADTDGLTDGAEVQTHNTDPTPADSDDDGFDDAAEIAAGTDPLDGLDYPILSDGDLSDDGQLDISDLLVGYQLLFNQLALTPLRLSHGDVAPPPNSDGMFTLGDVQVIQRMLLVQ
jgi:Bacterial TSP3 repeat